MTVLEYIEKTDKSVEHLPNQEECKRDILNSVDIWSNNAAAGYTAAAAIAAGLDQRQTARLLDALGAAFENMTAEEAIDFYQSNNF